MQHVGKHEAAFGVGIDDFDCLPRHRLDDVARALRLAVRHVFHEPDGADRIDLGLAHGERVHEPDHAGGARHVAFHVLHALRGLDRDAAGIEAHAFADERDRLGTALAAVPAHHDEPGIVHRALADAEQRAHAELAHRRHVEHLDADAELGQCRRAAGKLHRIENVRGLIDEIARQHHAVGYSAGARPCLLGGGRDWRKPRSIRTLSARSSPSLRLVL